MKIESICMSCLVAGVALSVFEYVLQIGATQSNMGGKKALRIAAVYSGIQLLFYSFLCMRTAVCFCY